MQQLPYIDAETGELVLPSGRRLLAIDDEHPLIAGGTIMSDELPAGRGQGGDGGEDDDREGERDDDEDDEDDEGYTPPSKTEWERMQSALKKLRVEKKEQKRTFEERIQNMSTEGTAAAQVEIEKAKIETERRVTKFWTTRAVRSEAKALFTAAGASEGTATRLSKMVDVEKVEYDEKEDDFDGLEDEVDEIMADHQDLFRKQLRDADTSPTPRRTRPASDAASRGTRGGSGSGRKQSSAERLAAGVLGRSPRRR